MSATTHSPADILRQALVDAGVGTLPSADGSWPVFVGHLPTSPDNALCVYDTAGYKDGRLMTGATVVHPGWQVRLRAVDHPTAWEKIKAITNALDAIHKQSVAIDAAAYTVAAVTQTSDVMTLGQEPDASRREQLTLNGTITFLQTT